MKRVITLSFFIFSFSILLGLGACKKDRNSIAVIFVEDNQGTPISGATVRLYSNGGVVDEQKKSSSDGSAEFSFENEAILLIEVTKDTLGPIDGGFVSLEAGETAEKTVILE